MRVLISAFSCNPNKGSEPSIGYNFVRQLARHCDLTVITEAIENEVALRAAQETDEYLKAVRFYFLRWPVLNPDGTRKDNGGFVQYYRYYRQWQLSAYKLAERLTREKRFDLVHHLTMQGYREPGFLWRLEIPFVWGPVGGFVNMPWRYLVSLGHRGALQYGIRNILNLVQRRTSIRARLAARKAAAVLASTSVDHKAIKATYGVEARLLGNGAAAERPEPPRPARRDPEVLTIAWSGLHIARKCLPILLNAVSLLPPDVRVKVRILGNGPENSNWKRLAAHLGIEQQCEFLGWVSRAAAVAKVAECDAFALTSLQDGGPVVLFEALSLSLPIIANVCSGYADVLDERCAILLPISRPAETHRLWAEAITRLYRDRNSLRRLSAGARAVAQERSWASLGNSVADVYSAILSPATTPAKSAREPLRATQQGDSVAECVGCGCRESRQYGHKRGLRLLQCAECDLIGASPVPTPQQLEKLYSKSGGYYNYSGVDLKASDPRHADALAAWLRRAGLTSGDFLDVGCSVGRILFHMKSRGWRVVGTEINPDAAAIARQHGLDIHEGQLESIGFQRESFDVAHLGDVLEHCNNPMELLRSVRAVLRPGGVVVVKVPDATCGYSRYSAWAARLLHIQCPHSEAPYHLFEFSPKSLGTLLANAGYEVAMSETYGEMPFLYLVGACGYFDATKRAIRGISGLRRALLLLPDLPGIILASALLFPVYVLGKISDRIRKRGTQLMMTGRVPRGSTP